ncbi:MAG: hypothetical protein QNJ72_39130 [Pleurocapsa sp. MO_226.B13]|nr:hypothetical protein [Pleurocapsa sp. MO_226.B13]
MRIEQGAAISANTFSLGNGGNAEINVDRLTIRNGGEISAGSFLGDEAIDDRRGEGGNLNVIARDSVLITGTVEIDSQLVTSSILTIAEGTGDAGNLNLTTNNLAIQDGGEINASATGSNAAGNLIIEAQAMDLDRGRLAATTSAGEGGNITLSIAENLTIGNESQISAEATGNANGGNIDLDANFVVAFSSQPNGSDIIARAEQGTGGNIDLTVESLLGISQGQAIAGNGNNDIDASSQFGLDGTVTIRVLNVEPIQEITELPQNVTDREQITTQACKNNSPVRGNTLTVTGKGGIRQQPFEPLNSEAIVIGQYEVERSQSELPEVKSFQTAKGKIIPAQGVVVTPDGQLILTSYPTGRATSRNSDNFSNCL